MLVPTYTLTPPTYVTRNPNAGVLVSRFGFDAGYALVVTGSSVEQVTAVGSGTWGTADSVFLGGHVYDISAAQAAVLTSAGYGAYITVT